MLTAARVGEGAGAAAASVGRGKRYQNVSSSHSLYQGTPTYIVTPLSMDHYQSALLLYMYEEHFGHGRAQNEADHDVLC